MEAFDVPLVVARQVGFVGVVAAIALVLAAQLRPVPPGARRRPVPLAGAVLVAAAMVAVTLAEGPERFGLRHVVGVTAAGLGVVVAARLRLPRSAAALLVLPGAATTVDAMGITDRGGAIGPAVVAAAVLAVLVAESDLALADSAAGPPLLAVSIFGMYATIPETAQILPTLVVAVPVALVGGPARQARLGTAGAAAAVVLLVAIVAEGGQPRAASIVGGVACLGVLALDPLVRAFAPGAGPAPDDWWSPRLWLLVAVHVVVVAIASRVAGLRDDASGAIVIVAVTAALAAGALIVLARNVERETGTASL